VQQGMPYATTTMQLTFDVDGKQITSKEERMPGLSEAPQSPRGPMWFNYIVTWWIDHRNHHLEEAAGAGPFGGVAKRVQAHDLGACVAQRCQRALHEFAA